MRLIKSYGVAIACWAAVCSAHAAIVITGTRVIYPEGSREVNVRLSNVEARPVLVQAWLDEGNPAASPDEVQVPFVLLPSVFRVEPHRGQSLRIMFTGAELPKDRESVYWLNVLEIPPKPERAEERNLIQLAFRTRIKLFYRPAGLDDDPTAARSQLGWRIVANEGGERVLRVDNPSPYYVSLGSVALEAGGSKTVLRPDMAPPFGHVDLVPDKGRLDAGLPATVSYGVLNDFGTEIKDSAQVGDAKRVRQTAQATGGAGIDVEAAAGAEKITEIQ